MFELSTQEFNVLRSQIATSSWGGERYLPYAFTEQGVELDLIKTSKQKTVLPILPTGRVQNVPSRWVLWYNFINGGGRKCRTEEDIT
ncbi:MAG: ORF6N domain-containing protein [Candidatus Omnitrophota bacterium]|nr:ORF6N domain-containing protein [Candidatus Omnitrophota bacterium]